MEFDEFVRLMVTKLKDPAMEAQEMMQAFKVFDKVRNTHSTSPKASRTEIAV